MRLDARAGIVEAVEEARLTVRVELLTTGESLRGHLVGPDGERVEFVGRVGLFAALELLVDAAVAKTSRS
jgi:hypothetical protein